MGILGWLRSFVADFFHADSDDPSPESRQAEADLEELRTVALLAAAQAHRTESELRNAMSAAELDQARLTLLVPRLEEERARAKALLDSYRERVEAEAERLRRLGELRSLEALNQRRARLGAEVQRAGQPVAEAELARMEDEARAEAYRLDVLEAMNAGEPVASNAANGTDLVARARRLLSRPGVDNIEQD